jgi:hypothetical protein
VDGAESARGIAGVADVFLRARAGSQTVFPRNNVEKCGNVITVLDDRKSAVEAARRAIGEIVVRLEPLDARTDEFLFRAGTDAFRLARTENMEAVAVMPGWTGDASRFRPGTALLVQPLPSLIGETAADWHGMTLLEAVDRSLRMGALRWGAGEGTDSLLLGSAFWKALLRGSLQGALYLVDSIHAAARQARLAEYLRQACGSIAL